jgi:hypothetical protein
MTSGLTGFSVGITNKMSRASAGVSTDLVIADGSVVAGIGFTFIDIDTFKCSLILVASVAFTGGLTVTYDAGTMSSAVDGIARALTNEANTMFGQVAVSIAEAVNCDTSTVLIVWIASEKTSLGAGTLSSVVDDIANGVGAARVVGTWINTTGNSSSITGGVRWAVHISSGTFARIAASCEAISDETIWTFTEEASQSILTDSTFVAWLVKAFVDILATIWGFLEARFAAALIECAHLVDLTIVVSFAAEMTVSMNT